MRPFNIHAFRKGGRLLRENNRRVEEMGRCEHIGRSFGNKMNFKWWCKQGPERKRKKTNKKGHDFKVRQDTSQRQCRKKS